MLFTFLKEHWSEITLAVGGVASFFAGRRSQNNNDTLAELNNIEKVREIEKSLLADMEEQINKMQDNIDRLKDVVEKQSKRIRTYEIKYGFLNEEDET